MKKAFFLFFLVCSSAFYAQNSQNEFVSLLYEFNDFFGEESFMNPSGRMVLDMGAASAGRVEFNIRDVSISMEEVPERPGCADVCPPMTLIYFKCNGKVKCVSDPIVQEAGTWYEGRITYGIEHGREAYLFLLKAQRYFKERS